MPIYEYRCADCKRRVSLYYQTFSAASSVSKWARTWGTTGATWWISSRQGRTWATRAPTLAGPRVWGATLPSSKLGTLRRGGDFQEVQRNRVWLRVADAAPQGVFDGQAAQAGGGRPGGEEE